MVSRVVAAVVLPLLLLAGAAAPAGATHGHQSFMCQGETNTTGITNGGNYLLVSFPFPKEKRVHGTALPLTKFMWKACVETVDGSQITVNVGPNVRQATAGVRGWPPGYLWDRKNPGFDNNGVCGCMPNHMPSCDCDEVLPHGLFCGAPVHGCVTGVPKPVGVVRANGGDALGIAIVCVNVASPGYVETCMVRYSMEVRAVYGTVWTPGWDDLGNDTSLVRTASQGTIVAPPHATPAGVNAPIWAVAEGGDGSGSGGVTITEIRPYAIEGHTLAMAMAIIAFCFAVLFAVVVVLALHLHRKGSSLAEVARTAGTGVGNAVDGVRESLARRRDAAALAHRNLVAEPVATRDDDDEAQHRQYLQRPSSSSPSE